MPTRLLPLAALFLLLCCGCGKKPSATADAVDRFVAGGIDSLVVHSIHPRAPEIDEVGDEETYEKLLSAVTPEFFHGHAVLQTATTDKPDEIAALLKSTTRSMRTTAYGAKCFDPRHGLRLTRGETHLDLVICYECEHVQLWEGGAKRPYETIAESSKAALDRFLAATKGQ
ncbi:MAG TPA: hypothetical protein PLA50_19935 [Bacteroidia bacterium]|nr:hypothetical protein [Bacteroidia bacterium]